jgi:hypothetical protein
MRGLTLLAGLIAVLVLVATAAGIFYYSPGSRIEYITVRGEHAVFQGTGLYRYDPVAVAREGTVWDVIDLFLGVPLLVAAIILTRRGSLRGRLLLGGLLFYFFYNYVMYATMVAFNRLFLVYVAIFGLCPVAFAMNLQGIEVSRLPAQVSARFPRRLFIGFAFVLSGALILAWMGRIVPIMITDRFPPDLAGMATLETQAIDLGMVVPLLLSTGVLLWRRSAWGHLLASISLTFGLMMCIAIPAWIVVPLIQDGKINPVEASPFLALSLVGLVLASMFYRSIGEGRHAHA